MGDVDEIDIIRRTVEACAGAGVRFALLFGSRAAGSSRPGSDVDIAIMVGSGDEAAILRAMPPNTDTLILDRAGLELAGRVAMNGRVIYEADPSERVAWQATTRTMYLDEKPRVDEARRVFAEGARARGRR